MRAYFDHNATTPLSAPVLDAVTAALRDTFGNASSIHHYGQQARQAVEQARRQVAERIAARPEEVVFTGSGTESNNMALFGLKPRHVITSTIEHPAVLNVCQELERRGAAVTYVQVGSSGVVDPDDVRRALRPDTDVISIMAANNELGTVQPVAEWCGLGVTVHSDCVQALCKIELPPADLMSFSGHKIYAPKGIGVLYARKGVHLDKLMFGGTHERGRRPGTENVCGATGFGIACTAPRADYSALRDRLERGILDHVSDTTVNGTGPRVGNTTNICFDGVEGEALLISLDLKGFAVSSGAACSSGAVEPSHVLTAIGLTKERARSSLRFSLGASNDEAQVDALIDAVALCTERLRKLSPAYV